MKRLLFFVPFLFLFHSAFSKQGHDSLFTKLNIEIDKKKDYDAEKIKRIEKLEQDLNNATNPPPESGIIPI